MPTVTCPSCGTSFERRGNELGSGVVAEVRRELASGHRSPEQQIEDAASVRCPECHSVFVGDYRFFGFLGVGGMKLLFGALMLLLIVAIYYVALAGS